MKLLKEPLLHFLVAGGLLFAAYSWLNLDTDAAGGAALRTVRITANEVEWLKQTWARQWQRPPSEDELRGLVTGYLKEALLAREALELGLDENDTVVRRRLAQKMEFLVQDTARLAEPSEDALRRLYETRRAEYRAPARVSFTQLYFRSQAAALQALDDLKTRGPADLGEPSLLERDYAGADERTVAAAFGPAFAGQVFGLEPGQWQGPLASAYGFHLVRVDERQAGEERPFEQVRTQVLDEWQRVQQAEASARFFDGLLKKYAVVAEADVMPLIGPVNGSPR